MAHEIHNYYGPADGDYARYVEQLLASAATQRQVQADVPAALRDAREAPGRPRISASGTPATPRPDSAAPRSQAVERQAQPWGKLFPFALWLLVVVTMVFWQGAAPWLIGLLIAGAWLFKGGRKALSGKALPGKALPGKKP